MRYCEKCGYVMDEFDYWRDKQNCPICGWMWSEDDMTALRYKKLSEEEKDAYDKQLINLIENSPDFDEFECNCSPYNGMFWSGFRVDKWGKLDIDVSIEQINEIIEDRKSREPFKPFPPIDTVKAREVALDAEITHKAIERGYYSQNTSKQENIPKCPICFSTNLSKISSLKKATKIGLFGIFGAGDVGKTWKCNNCGSKF